MPAEVLVPADAQAAVIAELKVRLPGLGFPVPVATRIPNPRPTEFVRVLRTGGFGSDISSDTATLVLEAYAANSTRAERLCAFALAAVQAAGRDGFMGGVPCRRVGVFSLPSELPDPSVTERYRYTTTVSAVLRRAAA